MNKVELITALSHLIVISFHKSPLLTVSEKRKPVESSVRNLHYLISGFWPDSHRAKKLFPTHLRTVRNTVVHTVFDCITKTRLTSNSGDSLNLCPDSDAIGSSERHATLLETHRGDNKTKSPPPWLIRAMSPSVLSVDGFMLRHH